MIIFSESPKDYEEIIMSRAERALFFGIMILKSQFLITVIDYITIMTQKRLERHACQQTQYKVIASFLQGKQVCSHFLK